MPEIGEYTSANMQAHDGLEGIRARPTVYSGSIGETGVLKMVDEAVANAMDEFTAGRGTVVDIMIDSKKHIVSVRDRGAGIPIESLKDAVSRIHFGGKFENKAYGYSIGLNAIGIKLINALSDRMFVSVWRDKKHATIEYAKAKFINQTLEDYNGPEQGTYIEFKPDITVLRDISMPKSRYDTRFEIFAYSNPGLHINFVYDGVLEKYYSETGMKEYFARCIKSKKAKILSDPIVISNETEMMESFKFSDDETGEEKSIDEKVSIAIEMHFTWAENVYSESIQSFINGLETTEGGTHVTGARAAITDAVKRYMDKNNLIPANAKYEIDGNTIRENLIAIVSGKHTAALYSTQIKSSISNRDIQDFAKSTIYSGLCAWLECHPKEAGEICKVIIRTAKAKAAAKEAKDNVIKSGKINALASIDPKKFKDCKSNKPEECEIFLVEGDSAGGSASQARNSDYQAIYKLRGKIQNVIQKSTVLSDELKQLIQILGCGYGETFNINKLRFHKIIFATDADSDGYHITSLLCGFFFTYMRELFDAGYIYTAKPPLYQLTIKGKSIFIPNMKYYNKAIEKIAVNTFDLINHNGVALSENLFTLYIRKIEGFKEFVDNFVIQTHLEPELLELIVYNYEDIKKKNFKALKSFKYDVTVKHEINGDLHVEIDREYEHYFLVLDVNFEENVYVPMIKAMGDIYLCGVKLKSKKTNTIYGGLMYRNACILDSLLMGKDVEVRRLKGLGECQPKDLAYFMFDDDTRNVVRLTVDDAIQTGQYFDIFLGKNIDEKKRLLSE